VTLCELKSLTVFFFKIIFTLDKHARLLYATLKVGLLRYIQGLSNEMTAVIIRPYKRIINAIKLLAIEIYFLT
jgi:hypothetical protein